MMRMRMASELVQMLDEVFTSRTLTGWEKHFEGQPLIWSPAREIGEIFDDPQIRAMGYFSRVEHPTAGPFDTVGPPLRMSAHPMPADRPAPALGADSEAVLREAGLDEADIRAALGRP